MLLAGWLTSVMSLRLRSGAALATDPLPLLRGGESEDRGSLGRMGLARGPVKIRPPSDIELCFGRGRPDTRCILESHTTGYRGRCLTRPGTLRLARLSTQSFLPQPHGHCARCSTSIALPLLYRRMPLWPLILVVILSTQRESLPPVTAIRSPSIRQLARPPCVRGSGVLAFVPADRAIHLRS